MHTYFRFAVFYLASASLLLKEHTPGSTQLAKLLALYISFNDVKERSVPMISPLSDS